MLFDGLTELPPRRAHGDHLRKISAYARQALASDAHQVLDDFLGAPADPVTLGVTGLHHVAVYAGDYHDEREFDEWRASVAAFDGFTDVRSGPSYIAPRFYGTPGHWMNLSTADGEIELFSCRASGDWAGFRPAEKVRLMSHFGLAVGQPYVVPALLDFLAARPEVEKLVYTPADELGHTYGHLRNTTADRVLEIVYSAPAGHDG